MRHLAVLSAAIAAVAVSLLVAPQARAACMPPSVSWANFPQEPQCVGGAYEFARNQWGLPFPGTGGHAGRDGCATLGACMEWVDQLPAATGYWNAHAWGSVTPQTYDIVVFPPIAGDAYGHIAVLDHVEGNTLWLMDDNWDGLGEKACAWEGHSGWVHSSTGWTPYGVFRLKSAEPAPCGCKEGDTETQACGCGTQTRSCSSCSWGDWSACAAPDYAASLVDVSYPQALAAGTSATIWADFQNVGAKTWDQDGLWLGALGSPDGGASSFFAVDDRWPAWNVSAMLTASVAPGDVGRFAFSVTAPSTPGATIAETFQLQLPGTGPITCPSGSITPSIIVTSAAEGAGGAPAVASASSTGGDPPVADTDPTSSKDGCSASPVGAGSTGSVAALALALMALLASPRRRHGRRSRAGARSV